MVEWYFINSLFNDVFRYWFNDCVWHSWFEIENKDYLLKIITFLKVFLIVKTCENTTIEK